VSKADRRQSYGLSETEALEAEGYLTPTESEAEAVLAAAEAITALRAEEAN
jgi:hypothetical protein